MIFIIVTIILALDQATKAIISNSLFLNQSLPVVKSIFHLTLVHNRGGAFGLFKNQTPVFIVTAIGIIILIFAKLKKNNKGLDLYSVSLALILAGALGNLIDRVTLGYVIDFLDLRIWPVFNVADSAISVGAILLGVKICFQKSAE